MKFEHKREALILFLAGVACVWSALAEAVELTEVSVNYKLFHAKNYAPYFTLSQKERLTLTVNVDLLPGIFWKNRIHGTTDSAQYRFIGYNPQIGLRPIKGLTLQFEHHSRHLLDTQMPGHFPVEDSVGATFYLYGGDAGSTLF